MGRWALIQNGVVKNIAVWEEKTDWVPPNTDILVDVTDIECDIGYIYLEGGEFIPYGGGR